MPTVDEMTAVQELLEAIRIGEPVSHEALTVVPLLAPLLGPHRATVQDADQRHRAAARRPDAPARGPALQETVSLFQFPFAPRSWQVSFQAMTSAAPKGTAAAITPAVASTMLRSGNLFESDAQTIAVTVNCVGVMGKGIALEARKRHPDLFDQYVKLCETGQMRLGRPVFVRRLISPSFLLFPTKDHWRSVSRLSDIEAGLDYVAGQYRSWDITSLAVPPLGCGHGGLEWAVVGPALYRGLARLEIPVYLYVPGGVPADAGELELLRGALTTSSDLLAARRTSPPEIVGIVLALARALELRPDKPFGRTLMQKLGYFAVAGGIPAPIAYTRRPFGPFSQQLHSHIRHLVNNGLLVEYRPSPGDALAYRPGPSLPEYSERLRDAIEPYRSAIDRVAGLIGSLSPEQAELAATTHMVAIELTRGAPGPVADDAIIRGVQEGKRRRRTPFKPDRIAACVRWLREKGWLATG